MDNGNVHFEKHIGLICGVFPRFPCKGKQNRDGAALVTSLNACCTQVEHISKSSTVKQYFLAINLSCRRAASCWACS